MFREFDDWYGADVVVATGWQTVYPVLELEGCRARAYLVNDHEPEFFATSVEREWARADLRARASTASPAARGCATCTSNRYGGQAGPFQYGVDETVYYPRPIARRRDTVVGLRAHGRRRGARSRSAFLGARTSCAARRPDVRIVLFGDQHAARARRSPTRTPASRATRSSPGSSRRPPPGCACR